MSAEGLGPRGADQSSTLARKRKFPPAEVAEKGGSD